MKKIIVTFAIILVGIGFSAQAVYATSAMHKHTNKRPHKRITHKRQIAKELKEVQCPQRP